MLKSSLFLVLFHCFPYGETSCECLILDKLIRLRPLTASPQGMLCNLPVVLVAFLAPVSILSFSRGHLRCQDAVIYMDLWVQYVLAVHFVHPEQMSTHARWDGHHLLFVEHSAVYFRREAWQRKYPVCDKPVTRGLPSWLDVTLLPLMVLLDSDVNTLLVNAPLFLHTVSWPWTRFKALPVPYSSCIQKRFPPGRAANFAA